MSAKVFWDWFQVNDIYIRKAVDDGETDPPLRIYTDFYLSLDAYHPQISYLIEKHPRKEGYYRMTLSANGDKSLLMHINHLINSAPQISYWEFKALFGPENDNEVSFDIWESDYTFLGVTFNPEQIMVTAQLYLPEAKKSQLLFLLPLRYSTYDQEKVETAFEMFLMEVMGEITMYENMASYDITYYNDDIYAFAPLECLSLIFEMSEYDYQNDSKESL